MTSHRNWLCYNDIALRIEGDEPPPKDPKASANPPGGVQEPEPSPSDSEKSSEYQEVDYDTDFEDNVSDSEQDKGTTRWTSVVIHSMCVNVMEWTGYNFPFKWKIPAYYEFAVVFVTSNSYFQ